MMLQIINTADINGDGFIDIAEWHTIAISQRKTLSDQQLSWAFNYFDTDGCGKITLEHIKKALKISDDQFNETYWSNVMREVAQDWDGSISFEAFKAMMSQETTIARGGNV